MRDHSDLIERLRGPCIDWTGEPIVDGSTPRYEVHCGLLREAASALSSLSLSLSEARAAKDGAYSERNQCVALIARFALAYGCRVGIAKTAIEGWDEAWHGCVYIDLPTGQVSWHYHDSEAHLFDFLPPYLGAWDGHTTLEKYERVSATFPIRPTETERERDEALAALREKEELRAARRRYTTPIREEDILHVAMERFFAAPGGNEEGIKAVLEWVKPVFFDMALEQSDD